MDIISPYVTYFKFNKKITKSVTYGLYSYVMYYKFN